MDAQVLVFEWSNSIWEKDGLIGFGSNPILCNGVFGL
jgi:hypothetical protein